MSSCAQNALTVRSKYGLRWIKMKEREQEYCISTEISWKNKHIKLCLYIRIVWQHCQPYTLSDMVSLQQHTYPASRKNSALRVSLFFMDMTSKYYKQPHIKAEDQIKLLITFNCSHKNPDSSYLLITAHNSLFINYCCFNAIRTPYPNIIRTVLSPIFRTSVSAQKL